MLHCPGLCISESQVFQPLFFLRKGVNLLQLSRKRSTFHLMHSRLPHPLPASCHCPSNDLTENNTMRKNSLTNVFSRCFWFTEMWGKQSLSRLQYEHVMCAEYLGWKIFEKWSLSPDSYDLKVVFAPCMWNAALILLSLGTAFIHQS